MRVMKRWLQWASVSALVVLAMATPAVAQAQPLVAGKDYLVLKSPQPTPPGKNVEVIEFSHV